MCCLPEHCRVGCRTLWNWRCWKASDGCAGPVAGPVLGVGVGVGVGVGAGMAEAELLCFVLLLVPYHGGDRCKRANRPRNGPYTVHYALHALHTVILIDVPYTCSKPHFSFEHSSNHTHTTEFSSLRDNRPWQMSSTFTHGIPHFLPQPSQPLAPMPC